MSRAWSPELVVGEGLARRLLADQFPDLAALEMRQLGEGWDVSAWLVGENLVFRFPRREIVVAGLRRELAVLPVLAPLLPIPIPAPAYAGRPSDLYPWPFWGAPLLPGRELSDAALTPTQRDALAPALGGFLRRLHSAGTRAAVGVELPYDQNGRADMSLRVPRTRQTLADLDRDGVWQAPAAVERLLGLAEALPPARGEVLTHGDLHLRHLLVDRGEAAAVIDWIDAGLGPPEIDLALYWCLFTPAGRAAFAAAYGEVGPEALLRARVLALNLCGILAAYAAGEGHEALLAETLGGLERTVQD